MLTHHLQDDKIADEFQYLTSQRTQDVQTNNMEDINTNPVTNLNGNMAMKNSTLSNLKGISTQPES